MAPNIENLFLAVVKPLIKSDILNRVYFHKANMDYEKFHNECIPRSCLPSEYFGDLDNIETLHNRNTESLMKLRDYFLIVERILNYEFEDYDLDAKSVDGEELEDTKI